MPAKPVPAVEEKAVELHHFFVMASKEDAEVYKFLETFKDGRSFRIVPVRTKVPVFLVIAENEVLLGILRKGFSNLVTFDSDQAKSLSILLQSPEVLEGEYIQKYLKSF